MTTRYRPAKKPEDKVDKPVAVTRPQPAKKNDVHVVVDKGSFSWFVRGVFMGAGFSLAVFLVTQLQAVVF